MSEEEKREIIMDNYLHPSNKEIPNNEDKYIKENSSNESCIDNLDLYVLIEQNIIKDIKFEGEACAISTSSTSIMIDELIGHTIEDAKEIILNYNNMINELDYNKDKLNNLIVFDEIYKQHNRKNCALLSFNGMERILTKLLEKIS